MALFSLNSTSSIDKRVSLYAFKYSPPPSCNTPTAVSHPRSRLGHHGDSLWKKTTYPRLVLHKAAGSDIHIAYVVRVLHEHRPPLILQAPPPAPAKSASGHNEVRRSGEYAVGAVVHRTAEAQPTRAFRWLLKGMRRASSCGIKDMCGGGTADPPNRRQRCLRSWSSLWPNP